MNGKIGKIAIYPRIEIHLDLPPIKTNCICMEEAIMIHNLEI